MKNFEQQFDTEIISEKETEKDFKFEQSLSPEAETDFEKSKKILAEIWPELTGSEKINNEEIENLSPTEYRSLLYDKMKPALEETIKSLDISIDRELLNNFTDNNDLSKKQIEIIRSLERQFKDVSVKGKLKEGNRNENTWSFYPKEIIKKQGVNCSGASLLFGYITEKIGIKTYQARTPNHAFNVLELDNGKLVFVDTRINSNDLYSDSKRTFIMDNKKEKLENVEYIKVDSYKLSLLERLNNFLQSKTTNNNDKIIILPQFEAVESIINNFGALKSEAAQILLPEDITKTIKESSKELLYNHSDEVKEKARQIYVENQESLSRLNFNALYNNLCEDITKIEKTIFPELVYNKKLINELR